MSNMYEMRVKVMNAPLLNLMRLKGLNSAADLSRVTGVCQASLGRMLNLKTAAFSTKGEVLKPVSVVAEYFNVLPECLFPDDNVYISLDQNTFSRQLSGEALARLSISTADPLQLVSHSQESKMVTIDTITETLNERERDMVKRRFEDGETFKEIAGIYNLSSIRVNQIITKATRKLKARATANNPLWAQFNDE